MMLIALVVKLDIRWRCYLHSLQIGSQDGTTCIGSKFGHQVKPLALIPGDTTYIATLTLRTLYRIVWLAALSKLPTPSRVIIVTTTCGFKLPELQWNNFPTPCLNEKSSRG